MNTMDTYIDVLLTSLKKKKNVLEKLDRVVINQEQAVKLPKVNIDDLDELQKQKGDLIAEIEQLEEGFEKVYTSILSAARSPLSSDALDRLSVHNGTSPSNPLKILLDSFIQNLRNNSFERRPLKSIYIY